LYLPACGVPSSSVSVRRFPVAGYKVPRPWPRQDRCYGSPRPHQQPLAIRQPTSRVIWLRSWSRLVVCRRSTFSLAVNHTAPQTAPIFVLPPPRHDTTLDQPAEGMSPIVIPVSPSRPFDCDVSVCPEAPPPPACSVRPYHLSTDHNSSAAARGSTIATDSSRTSTPFPIAEQSPVFIQAPTPPGVFPPIFSFF